MRKTWSWLVASAVMLTLLAGCGGSKVPAPAPAPAPSAGSQPAAPPAPSVIKIGAVFPLTGKQSKVGGGFKQAAEFAVKEWNDQGGVSIGGKKVPIELQILDDTTNPTTSAQLVEQLITKDKVNVILGGYSTELVAAQAVVPDRYGIPFVNGGGAATAIYGKSKWVFGTLAPVENLAITQMEFLKDLADQGKLPKPVSVYVAWENTDHGVDYLNGVKLADKQYPGYFTINGDESFQLNATDFGPLLTKLKNANAAVFLCDAHLPDFLTMHKQYLQMGLKHKMITYGARGAEGDARKAMGDGVNYIFASNWWTSALTDQYNKDFVAKWGAAYKEAPEWWHAISYEGARALLRAIEKAGSVEPEKVRQALVAIEYKDALVPGGVMKFSATGQAIYPFVVTENKPDGKVDIVYPKSNATGPVIAPIPGT